MWIKKVSKDEEIIVFIEPHGLEHSKGLKDEKIQFAKSIKDIEQKINKKENKNIRLEYFLLSVTKYDEIRKGTTDLPTKEDFENKNVLFIKDDQNWPQKLFKKIGVLIS